MLLKSNSKTFCKPNRIISSSLLSYFAYTSRIRLLTSIPHHCNADADAVSYKNPCRLLIVQFANIFSWKHPPLTHFPEFLKLLKISFPWKTSVYASIRIIHVLLKARFIIYQHSFSYPIIYWQRWIFIQFKSLFFFYKYYIVV